MKFSPFTALSFFITILNVPVSPADVLFVRMLRVFCDIIWMDQMAVRIRETKILFIIDLI